MSSRLRARADRVKKECDLGGLLQEYGYDVVPDSHREQQFACQLHGADNKPSARFYPQNNSTYCWVCQKTRDPLAYVMEHEHVEFREAVQLLEKRLGLPSLPWEEAVRPKTVAQEIDDLARGDVPYDREAERVRRLLDGLTRERDLDAEALVRFWEAYDRVEYGMAREGWEEYKAIQVLQALRERIMQKLKGSA
jgi:hypothetical protein